MGVTEALETIELQIMDALAEAEALQSTQIYVTPPELPPELAPDEIILNFGINTPRDFNESRHLWDDLISEFVASHPRVGDIDLDTQIYSQSGLDEDIDCWYNNFGSSFSYLTEPPEEFLALDPFLSADPDFSRDSFLPGVLESTQIQNQIYGYPLTVQPIMMKLNIAKFEEANLPLPGGSWTINEFTNALIALGRVTR